MRMSTHPLPKAVEEDKPVPMPPEVALRDLKAVLDVYNNQCI